MQEFVSRTPESAVDPLTSAQFTTVLLDIKSWLTGIDSGQFKSLVEIRSAISEMPRIEQQAVVTELLIFVNGLPASYLLEHEMGSRNLLNLALTLRGLVGANAFGLLDRVAKEAALVAQSGPDSPFWNFLTPEERRSVHDNTLVHREAAVALAELALDSGIPADVIRYSNQALTNSLLNSHHRETEIFLVLRARSAAAELAWRTGNLSELKKIGEELEGDIARCAGMIEQVLHNVEKTPWPRLRAVINAYTWRALCLAAEGECEDACHLLGGLESLGAPFGPGEKGRWTTASVLFGFAQIYRCKAEAKSKPSTPPLHPDSPVMRALQAAQFAHATLEGCDEKLDPVLQGRISLLRGDLLIDSDEPEIAARLLTQARKSFMDAQKSPAEYSYWLYQIEALLQGKVGT